MQMYQLVADVGKYPEFLPWCSAARIRSRVFEGSSEVMLADLIISFKVFRERFGSKVVLKEGELIIVTEYLDGPFKFLKSSWKFEVGTDTSCNVEFFVDFEFRSRILEGIIGIVFNQAMQRIVRAFEKRAEDLYS
jgi:coenzyme Q-binding protein COQ10